MYRVCVCPCVRDHCCCTQVETSDHARLRVAYSMNNYFEVCMCEERGTRDGGNTCLSGKPPISWSYPTVYTSICLHWKDPPLPTPTPLSPSVHTRRSSRCSKDLQCTRFHWLCLQGSWWVKMSVPQATLATLCNPSAVFGFSSSLYVTLCVLSHNVASRVRGTVARIPFEEFHRHSAEIVRSGVFGRDEKDEIKSILHFMANNLVRARLW